MDWDWKSDDWLQIGTLPDGVLSLIRPDCLVENASTVWVQPRSFERHLRKGPYHRFGDADAYRDQFSATIGDPAYVCNHTDGTVNAMRRVDPPRHDDDRDWYLVIGFSIAMSDADRSFIRTMFIRPRIDALLQKSGIYWPEPPDSAFGTQQGRRIRR